MPAEGIPYLPKSEVLSYEEMLRLVHILAALGVHKVRITGGEPFVRRGLMDFLQQLSQIQGINEINLTTNGVLTAPYVPALKAMGIASVNLSLDSLDRARFHQITRRDVLPQVMECFHSLLDAGIPVKINAVVMEGQNIEDILPMVEMTRHYPVSVRFIEEMPFNGEGSHYPVLHWTHHKIMNHIRQVYPNLEKIPDAPASTSSNYAIPGHQGNIGIIAAFSRTFCGTCNRIRITASGSLKTCLYDDGALELKPLLRNGLSDQELAQALTGAFRSRAANGFEAERKRSKAASESMSSIGG
jgi:cyclic pyranopterin phosphate synthase